MKVLYHSSKVERFISLKFLMLCVLAHRATVYNGSVYLAIPCVTSVDSLPYVLVNEREKNKFLFF